jgi:1,2-dihydroxy-3-keto-5-methylthiopentene dioxygenase
MARITVAQDNRRIDAPEEIRAFLAPYGIWYEQWQLEERVDPDASPDEILAAYAPEVQRLMQEGGYTTADVINVSPDVVGLQEMLDRFNKEHTHSEDEVRFIVKGRGIFFIHPADENIFAIQVEGGDLINVPKGTRHWFDLCEERTIRAIRLFQDRTGWTPQYEAAGVHSGHAPLCWGPNYLPASGATSRSENRLGKGDRPFCSAENHKIGTLPAGSRTGVKQETINP